jgi:hypothetical protein
MPTGILTNPALAQQLLDALDGLSGLHPGCIRAFGPPMPEG